MRSRPPLQFPAPLYVRILAVLGSCVFSGIGPLAVLSGHVEERWTRYGYTGPLDGGLAHCFGATVFFLGLVPLMLAAPSARAAKRVALFAAAAALCSPVICAFFHQ